MSLLDAGFQLVGNWLNNEAAEDRQNAAQGWSAEQYAKRYQTQVKDLEAAGLNPMLAVSQGAPPAPQAQPVTLQNPYSSAFRLTMRVYVLVVVISVMLLLLVLLILLLS